MLKLANIISGISITFMDTNEYDAELGIVPNRVDQIPSHEVWLSDERRCRDQHVCVLQ